jgi:predicted transcriptional regulator
MSYNVVVATTVNDTVVSVRLDSEIVSQLDELAAEMQRSRSFLIAQAVQEFVEREYPSLLAIREGEADIQAGRSLEGSAALQWLEDLKAGRTGEASGGRTRKRG